MREKNLNNQKQLPLLTSLRFVAAFEVLLFHVFQKQLNEVHPRIRDLFSNGYEAVLFFFLLSGFVLTRSCLMLEGENGSFSLYNYYRNRIARIYPVYLLGLLIAAPAYFYSGFFTGGIHPDVFSAGLLLVPMALQSWYPPTALAWNPPSWSLSVEASFYAIMPFVIPRYVRLTLVLQVMVSLTLILAAEALRNNINHAQSLGIQQLTASHSSNNFQLYFPMWFMPIFLLGATLAKAYNKYPPSIQTANIAFNLSITAVLGLFSFRSLLPHWFFSMPILALLFSTLIFAAASSHCWLSKLLSTRWAILLGQSSYALYILHIPLHFWWLRAFSQLSANPTWHFIEQILFCCVVIALSILCFLLFEVPMQHFLRTSLSRSQNPPHS